MVILVTPSQSLILQGFDGNQTVKKVVTDWLLWLLKGVYMDKFTLAYNVLNDSKNIIARHKSMDVKNEKDCAELMSDIEQTRIKYEEYPKAHELFTNINLAILNYLDYTKE